MAPRALGRTGVRTRAVRLGLSSQPFYVILAKWPGQDLNPDLSEVKDPLLRLRRSVVPLMTFKRLLGTDPSREHQFLAAGRNSG